MQSLTPPAPVVNKPSAEERRATLARDVKPLIQPNSFTGGGAVTQLTNLLDDFGMNDVDSSIRLEVLTKIRDNAGNHYFRAWVDNPVAMDVIREWLKAAFVGRTDPQLVETIMPILHVSADRNVLSSLTETNIAFQPDHRSTATPNREAKALQVGEVDYAAYEGTSNTG